MKFINSILGVLCKEKPSMYFSSMPGNSSLVNGKECFKSYPEKTFLGDKGLCAYYVILLLKHDEFAVLEGIIKDRFDNSCLRSDATYRNQNQEALAISYHEDFGGVLIEMTTNSLAVILKIDLCSFSPAPPWEIFPKLEPIEMEMNKQGSLEYWWSHIWLPFWPALTEAEKNQYFHDNNASAEWIECLAGQAYSSD